jgi:NarL family two-component system sensor histidine kinase LiaS
MIEDVGLIEALHWLCREYTVLNQVPCSLESVCDEHLLTQEIKLDLFRICQETLGQLLDPDRVQHVYIRIEKRDDQLCLIIKDEANGWNLDPNQINLGLTHLKERASLINGQVAMEQLTDKQTAFCFSIMLHS